MKLKYFTKILSRLIFSSLFILSQTIQGSTLKKSYVVDPNNPYAPTEVRSENKVEKGKILLREPILTVTEKQVDSSPKAANVRKKSKIAIKLKAIKVDGLSARPRIPFTEESLTLGFIPEPSFFKTEPKLFDLNESALLNR